MENKKLTLKTKLGFGVLDLGGNIFWTVTAFWLMHFLTDNCGLSAGLAGTAILIGKIWDAVTDPAVGYLSDHTTKHRWGRRRPWIFYGSFFLCIMTIVMFTNPGIKSQAALFIWAIASWVLLCTAYTLVGVPYYALTPELTSDYDEQTSLNGYRMSFAVIGILISAGATLPIVGLFSDKNTGYSGMGAIYGLIMLITALITFFTIRETGKTKIKRKTGFVTSYLSAFKNIPFLLLMFPYAMMITATTMLAGTAVYYFKYIFEAEGMTTIGLLLWHIAMLIFIPIWVLISKKVGKKLCYILGMCITTLAVICLFFFGHIIGMKLALVMLTIGGIGYTTNLVMSWSTIPDTLEYNYAKTGERSEGIFYGVWTFFFKLGQALAAAIIGWVLAGFGYVADVNTPETQLAVRLLVGPLPALFMIGAIIIHSFYPLTKERYEEVLAKIKEMEATN